MAQSEAGLVSAQRQLPVLDKQLEKALAELNQNEASLQQAREDLDDTVIRAPADGVVGQRMVKDGQFVNAGQVLFVLVQSSTVWVDANFKETQIGQMKRFQPVELEIDAFPGQTISGYIDSLSPASGAEFALLPPQNATGNFTKIVQRIPVKIAVLKSQPLAGQLRAGMSAEVSVDVRGNVKPVEPELALYNNIKPADMEENHVASR